MSGEPRIGPVTGADAVRARLPELLQTYSETRATVLEDGLVDTGLKELCARYLAEDFAGAENVRTVHIRIGAALDTRHRVERGRRRRRALA